MNRKRVLIMGPIAPPFGGVSVHILRLTQLLKSCFDFDFIDESRTKKTEYFNLRSFQLLRYLKKIRQADFIYINSGKSSLRIFHLLIGKVLSKKIILTIHSFPKKRKSIQKVISRIYSLADKLIIVNEDLMQNLILPKDKYIIKEAFIPPIIENEPELPSYISKWLLEKKERGKFIICANASCIDTFNNEDLYGIDLCISVCDRLRKKNIPASFIFVVSSVEKNEEQFKRYKDQVADLQLVDDFFLVNEKLSFIRLIQMSDLVLRTTNTDGDALTVREALYLNKPVLASDVVKRPERVSLFMSRNIDDLELKLKNLIGKINNQNCDSKNLGRLDDSKQFYINLLETV